METVVGLTLLIAACAPALLVAVFGVETLAAIMPAASPREASDELIERGGVAVLIPAHNEGAAIAPTIDGVRAQLRPGDRVVVIADNCSDDTAAVASRAGAEVVERHDIERRGKGYALEFGRDYLAGSAPDIVIVIDADCAVGPLAIERLARMCSSTGAPVQALDVMVPPQDSVVDYTLAAFAWRVNTHVRPRGLKRLGFPCQLMGTGMAFPWRVFRSAELATGNIVEDMKLGLDLACAGHAAQFCPDAVVTSEFPVSQAGAHEQRKRWEGGHLTTLKVAARLVLQALRRRNWPLLALTLDIAVPPLTLLALWNGLTLALTGAAYAMGAWGAPFAVSAVSCGALFVSIALCWRSFGRDLAADNPARALAAFLRAKSHLYFDLLRRGPNSKWVRAERADRP